MEATAAMESPGHFKGRFYDRSPAYRQCPPPFVLLSGPLTEELNRRMRTGGRGSVTPRRKHLMTPVAQRAFGPLSSCGLCCHSLGRKELMLWNIFYDDWRHRSQEWKDEVKGSVASWNLSFSEVESSTSWWGLFLTLLDGLDSYSKCHSELAQLSVISE